MFLTNLNNTGKQVHLVTTDVPPATIVLPIKDSTHNLSRTLENFMKNTMSIHKLMPNFSGRHYSWTPEGEPAIIGNRVCITLTGDNIDLWFADWTAWLRDSEYTSELSPRTLSLLQESYSLHDGFSMLNGEAYATIPVDDLQSVLEFLQCNKRLLGLFPKKQLSESHRLRLVSSGFKKKAA